MKRIIRENTLSTKQHILFEGTDEQRTDEAWEVTCDYLGDKQKRALEGIRFQMEEGIEREQLEKVVTLSMLHLGISGDYPYQAMAEFFEGKREFS
jgi:hypothetical protein